MSQACFQPLDPAIVDASIPTFFVGRNGDGFWIARDANSQTGGLFLFKSSALAFARRADSQTARFSTGVISLGTLMTTLGRTIILRL